MRTAWVSGISEQELRRASGSLRRLTVPPVYSEAWRAVGLAEEPRVPTLEVESRLDAIVDLSPITLLVYGGATGLDEEVLSHAWMKAGAFSVDDDPSNLVDVPWSAIGLTKFMEGTAAVVTGERISRRHVVKYVSNRLGGPHVGLARAPAGDRRPFELLDELRDFDAYDHSLPYYLLLTIGYAIAHAPDTELFCARAGKQLGLEA